MENIITQYNSVLTIAGSDSGGCAGIQADIKSISACGAYAASVITATTAQNTQGVTDIHSIPVSHIKKQLDAVLSDINFGAVKIGMLHSLEIIECIIDKLGTYNVKNIVVDPVMIATSGDPLITNDAIKGLKKLLPKATLITPNIPEAELLIDYKVDFKNLKETAIELGKLYNTSVLLKGGHLDSTTNTMTDTLYLCKENKVITITNPWINTKHTHGTGCSLSSSIATFLSLGDTLEIAVQKGCNYINVSIAKGSHKTLGKGNGPINHFEL